MVLISKTEIEEIIKNKGEVIGASFKEDLEFILEKEGKEGLKKLEEEMKKLGYPIDFKKIKSFQWYPLSLNMLYLVVAKDVFDWPDDLFRENGRFSARISLIARIMMKYIISLERCFNEAGNFWQKYYTVGRLTTENFDKKNRTAFLVLKDFTGHPVFCHVLEGYFWQVISYVVPKEKLKVKEIECIFKEGKTHKFQVTW
ncbi:MAG: hypothetical protein A2Z78_00485 [Candidatus Nealsonbacteria bacterium RBG_13_36_15]|uniref:4-vinyl reductase 4VR domain-containing protein n=1 Tax=Candidatus Nealsonbacteria bacterium RBG_13_36_15 TaxID=1801660 RepID=A0A1G2DVM5_9BACT|nr:MAG: hypothetical protein A2Z78_00485 [Candidatus Nealsonbacteria bacterium RBG_13_36_15]